MKTNSFYVLVNVLGMGIAIACCVIAFTNYQFEKNFDAFHSKKDTVFRVDSRKASNSFAYGITPFPLGKEAAERIPEVKQAVRLYSRNAMVKSGQTVFNENLHFVDGGFFDLFDFPIISGSVAELEKPESIMLTAEMAIYFLRGGHRTLDYRRLVCLSFIEHCTTNERNSNQTGSRGESATNSCIA